MRKILITFFVILIAITSTHAQLNDNFNDGDFTNNPAWSGSSNSDWQVNSSFQLQSNNTVANSNFYLATASTKATMAQWDFYTQITFNPSSANYIDVFLTASAQDLTLASTTGYFVRIGNTDDEISLYRKDAGSVVEIIDGANGVLNTSLNTMRIRVVRNAANQWILSRDLTGTGTSYTTEGTATDASYTSSAFFGMHVRQSTVASFAQRHFFDDFTIQDYVPDVTPPAIVSATATSQNSLDIVFNEPVDLATSQSIANYSVSNGVGFPSGAVRDVSNPSLVHLTFAGSFPSNQNLTLTVNGIKDISGNTLSNGVSTFVYFTAAPYNIIIDEIMADPTPLVALPDAEWIELKNTSGFDINLQGWRIGKPSGQSGPMPSYILKADSFVVVTSTTNLSALSVFGPAISVTSFPALSNSGDLLYLRSPQGAIIHSVNYSDAWYQNELKKDGGWSLEMIDTNNPCSGISNWKASTDPRGGTPGKINSVNGPNPDQAAPRLLRAYATDSLNLVLVFNEPVDSIRAAQVSAYTISNIGAPAIAIPQSPQFSQVLLRLPASQPLIRGQVYTITVSGVADCSGNIVTTFNTARVGLYENIDSFDIVVNEILFNPVPSGTDYVEIYNRSEKTLNLRNLYIANRNSAGQVSSIQQVSAVDYLFFPGDFLVITEDASLVKNNFVANNPDGFIEIASMPSYSDDEGTVVLLNQQGRVIDEVNYKDDWHFALISNDEGVALERIDYDGRSQDPKNWHSAASTVGYGTPTYRNSQYRINEVVEGTISVSPSIISPDNDGLDDFADIRFRFPAAGYVASVTIFDAVGRPVRYLQRNTLNGLEGSWRWDGLGEKNTKLLPGIYVILTEVFNLDGKTKKFKNTIVLARKR